MTEPRPRSHYHQKDGKRWACCLEPGCHTKRSRNQLCAVHQSHYKGKGRIKCAICGEPLRDHALNPPPHRW